VELTLIPSHLYLTFSNFETVGYLFDSYENALGLKDLSKTQSTAVNDADWNHEMLSKIRGFLEREERVKQIGKKLENK
jgi:hypothetical protein